jgi:hypothetical protein
LPPVVALRIVTALLISISCELSPRSAWGQPSRGMYFTAPFGEGGTWNLYELSGGAASSNPRYAPSHTPAWNGAGWQDARLDAESRVERLSGKQVRGHLVAIESAAENEAVQTRAGRGGPYWIGLSDDEAYGGGESASVPPNPTLDGLKGLHGESGDGVGWKWSNGDSFGFANWAEGQPSGEDDFDYVGVYSQKTNAGQWFDSPGDVAQRWITEYDTEMPYDFLVDQQPRHVPGPSGGWGTWGVREVTGVGSVLGLNGTLEQLLEIPSGTKVVDYQTSVLDYSDYESRPTHAPIEVDRRFETPGAQDHLAMVAHSTIRIPEGQGGNWRFRVTSDDAAELWIKNRSFHSVSGWETVVSPYGSMAIELNRSMATSEGIIELPPGDYEVELIYNEFAGYAALEVSASGPGSQEFALIGDPGAAIQGATPYVLEQFHVRQVRRTGEGTGQPQTIGDLAEARLLLDSPGPLDEVLSSTDRQIFFEYGAKEVGWFKNIQDVPAKLDGGAFALSAEGVLRVETAGEYTFGFHTGSGAALSIDGVKFAGVGGVGQLFDDGHTLLVDQAGRTSLAVASAWLEAGDYPLELITYNDAREAGLIELLVSPGAMTSMPARGAFRLLTDVSQAVDHVRPAGLQLIGQALPGDADEDGKVDLTDFGILKLHFGTGSSRAEGDFNSDGTVDLSDFGILKSNFGTAAAAVPEPTSAGLFVAGLVLLVATAAVRRSRTLCR